MFLLKKSDFNRWFVIFLQVLSVILSDILVDNDAENGIEIA
jgi:hypothetical protein